MIRDDADSAESVKIRYNRMSQWNHQKNANNQDPVIHSNMDASGLSANLQGIWKGKPAQRAQADKTMREQVSLLEAMGKC